MIVTVVSSHERCPVSALRLTDLHSSCHDFPKGPWFEEGAEGALAARDGGAGFPGLTAGRGDRASSAQGIV